MDSTNSSYVDLLTSQHNSFSQGIDLESTEVPFYFQSPDAPVLEAKTHKGRRKWSPAEDNVLISAWLNTSKDAIVGNQQKAGTFWKRIVAYFASSPKLSGLPPREPSLCKQRWQKINEQVCKFVGAYETAKKQTSSGQNDNDTLKMAHQIFHNDHNFVFILEHAWKELRNDQKWCASFNAKTGGSSKRRRGEADTEHDGRSPIVLEDVDEAMARPIGVKAAKAKAKKGEPISLEQYETMRSDRKEDLAVRERLSRHAILDSLLAKKEPLSEKEIALKDKLIDDMMSN